MSSFNRRTAFLSLAALAGCGFAPVYAPGGSAENLRGSILVAEPNNEASFRLVQELEQRLGQPSNPRYTLSYSLDVNRNADGILPNAAITRYTLVGRASYALRANDGGSVVSSGQVENFTNYSNTATSIARQAAEEDARLRLIVMLAEDIVTRLSLLDL